jgi:hypothetical protein
MSKPSAVEKGKINKSRFSDYIHNLELTGKKFPINNFGAVNLSEVAKQCGFNRQVFSTNVAMRELLAAAIKRIGTSVDPIPAKLSPDTGTSRDINNILKTLDLRDAEIAALKNEIRSLKQAVFDLECKSSECTSVFDDLLLTGRRFHL